MKELQGLEQSPPAGVTCWAEQDALDNLRAQVLGAAGTPYAGGVFLLAVNIPPRYPFEPPKVRFLTPIYHPNIDTAGRICLDVLKMPPRGAWKPAVSLGALLTSIQLLMAEPNPDDGLLPDVVSNAKEEGLVGGTHQRKKRNGGCRNEPTKTVACVRHAAQAFKQRSQLRSSSMDLIPEQRLQ